MNESRLSCAIASDKDIRLGTKGHLVMLEAFKSINNYFFNLHVAELCIDYFFNIQK